MDWNVWKQLYPDARVKYFYIFNSENNSNKEREKVEYTWFATETLQLHKQNKITIQLYIIPVKKIKGRNKKKQTNEQTNKQQTQNKSTRIKKVSFQEN